jgi:hypothetical protein
MRRYCIPLAGTLFLAISLQVPAQADIPVPEMIGDCSNLKPVSSTTHESASVDSSGHLTFKSESSYNASNVVFHSETLALTGKITAVKPVSNRPDTSHNFDCTGKAFPTITVVGPFLAQVTDSRRPDIQSASDPYQDLFFADSASAERARKQILCAALHQCGPTPLAAPGDPNACLDSWVEQDSGDSYLRYQNGCSYRIYISDVTTSNCVNVESFSCGVLLTGFYLDAGVVNTQVVMTTIDAYDQGIYGSFTASIEACWPHSKGPFACKY